ncbi:MAG: hypothetical protein ABSC31_09835 [Acidimicrobiales bacterium]
MNSGADTNGLVVVVGGLVVVVVTGPVVVVVTGPVVVVIGSPVRAQPTTSTGASARLTSVHRGTFRLLIVTVPR